MLVYKQTLLQLIKLSNKNKVLDSILFILFVSVLRRYIFVDNLNIGQFYNIISSFQLLSLISLSSMSSFSQQNKHANSQSVPTDRQFQLESIERSQEQVLALNGKNNEEKCSIRSFIIAISIFLLLQLIFIVYYLQFVPPQEKIVTKQIVKQEIVVKQLVKKQQVQKLYVNPAAKAFPTKVKLDYNYSKQIQPITAVFTSSGRRYDLLQMTLLSFFANNSYPIQQLIVVDDDFYNEKFENLTKMYENITWISCNLKVGQVYAVDLAYKYVKTQYLFHSEDDFVFTGPGFIEKSLQIMLVQPKVSQVIIRHWGDLQDGDKQGVIDPQKSNFSAFSFNPSVKRMKQYRIFTEKFGGFSEYTKFYSFEKGAGGTQVCMSIYLINKGYYGYRLKDQYVVHIGQNKGLQKYWNGYSNTCSFI